VPERDSEFKEAFEDKKNSDLMGAVIVLKDLIIAGP